MTTGAKRGQVLVAIMNNNADLGILREQGWCRIPVATAPQRWSPKWLAFYQTKVFDDGAFAVRYYGLVRSIRIVRRYELFPKEPLNPKSERKCYEIHLHSLEQLPAPIYSRRLRRIVFISTTWQKFSHAIEINDLFDESPPEDRLWAELKRLAIPAERQWGVPVGKKWYVLDFALFCTKGSIDIETDGDAWHIGREQAPKDNLRNNALESVGWHVLRFNGHQIRESMNDYCVPEIAKTINSLGGLDDKALVPRVFHQASEGIAQQLSLFEKSTGYDLE
jgi:very-short-patch-repair endonuclease